jgi:hypothetical protein
MAQGERMASELVARIANSEKVQRAASLAKTGMVAAHHKVRTVSQQMQASYKVGRDKATSMTKRGRGTSDDGTQEDGETRTDTEESKEAAVNYVADFLESDTTKVALTAGAHLAAAFAGSKVGMSPSMTSMAASGVIESGVELVQDSAVTVAQVSVNALNSVVPDAIGIASGVSYAMADTTLRETTGAINGMVGIAKSVVSAAVASSSGGARNTESKRHGEDEEDEEDEGKGPEIEVVESSSSEEEYEDVSDLEDFDDA